MSITARLDQPEASLPDAILWREVQRLAREIGSSPETLFADAKRFTDRYSDLMRPGPDGKVALAPALQAIAADEGLDYRELEASARRYLRRWRRRDVQWTKRQS
jgi:hypothetical protein